MQSGETIREHVRSTVAESRLASRDKIWKTKRKALQDFVDIGRDVSEEEVTILANKLKSKSTLQAEDLALIKIAFVQSGRNILTFLKVKGALHGLIRELSSTRPNFELLAAECICNLALGDAKSCLIVAKAAGPYLITILSGCNNNLMATSVWALGNLVGSGEKTWKIIHSQGFLSKLLHLITQNDSRPDLRKELQYNSLIALSELLHVGAKLLTVEEVQSISKTVASLKNSSHMGLRVSGYLLSCTEAAEKELIENKVHLNCLEFLANAELNVETVKEFTACVRTIANLIAELSGTCALEVFHNWDCIQKSIQKICTSSYSHLVLELGWLLGNLINHPSPQVQAKISKFSCDFEFYETKLVSFSS